MVKRRSDSHPMESLQSIEPFRCSPMFGGGRATQEQVPRGPYVPTGAPRCLFAISISVGNPSKPYLI
jgi:hypothetical protein